MSPGMFLCAQKNEGPIYTALLREGGGQAWVTESPSSIPPPESLQKLAQELVGAQGPGFTSQHRH